MEAVQMQPKGGEKGGAGWVPVPQHPVNCPPGLEYLTKVDQLLIKQKVEVFETFSGFETNNRYDVVNTMGQNVYYVAEDTCCCTRNCCGDRRPFNLKVLDNGGKEVMHMESPLRCDSCWCPCCLRKVVVTSPPGETIGLVRQAWSLIRPCYKIQDANDQTVLTIEGPMCHCRPCGDVEFRVMANDGTHVGMITKQWSGLVNEILTDADNFGVIFPMDLHVNIKATLLAAVFLIDFMYFEDKDGKMDD